MNTEELLENSKKLVNEIHRTAAVVEQCRNLEAALDGMQIVFADAERKNIADVCMVLSGEQEKNLKQIIIRNIVMNRENAEKKLAELTGSGNPAGKETGNTGHSTADQTAPPPDKNPVKAEDRRKRKKISAEGAEERIRKIREMANAGMSQAEIAKRLDISPGRVWQLVRQHGIRAGGTP